MSTINRPNRKATDDQIIRLNSVGLSLGAIGKILDCHPTTITQRLQQLNITPANTRRTFMEEIYNSLSPSQQEWLADQLGPHTSVKDFIRNIIVEKFIARHS